MTVKSYPNAESLFEDLYGMKAYEFGDFFIPEHMMESLKLYVNHGIRPGDFLMAVLTNNLMEAVGRADYINIRNLPAYCAWLYNEAPPACYGSNEKYSKWILDHMEKRHANMATDATE